MRFRTGVCFDDVLLVPRYSEVTSRAHPDLSVEFPEVGKLSLPIIASPMDTITETSMADALVRAGGLGVVHRYNTEAEQVALVSDTDRPSLVGAALGVTGDYHIRACALFEAGVRLLCLDIAHGHHRLMKEALFNLREIFGYNVHLMAGNVATLEGFNALADWGADSIRVGIGGGSICTTRLQTGHGVPTLQSVLDCAGSDRDALLIADGGIRTSGDIVKALAAGADAVMLGSLLSGTTQTPGKVRIDSSGNKFKSYRGMASRSAQVEWRGSSSTPEGVATLVPFRGCVSEVLRDVEGGIRSGLSYSGANSLEELRTKATFIKQTSSGRHESSAHVLSGNEDV